MENMGEDVIHHMMKETVSMAEEGKLSEFSKELESVLNDLVFKHHGHFFSLRYIANTQMFRLILNGQTLDIPSNWSFFREISSSCERNEFSILPLTTGEDDDFLDVISQFCKDFDNLTFVSNEGQVYLCVTPSSCSFLTELYAYLGRETSGHNKAA